MDDLLLETFTSETYKKKYRLNTPLEFKEAFDTISKKQTGKFFTLLCSNNKKTYFRLGLVVPKKQIPLAVDRNKIKREIREFFRCFIKNDMSFNKKFDVIVLVKSPAKLLTPKQINEELEIQWNKLKNKQS